MKDLRRLGRIAAQRLFLTRPGLKSPDKQAANCKPGNDHPIPARSAFAFARREQCLNALFASSLCIGLVFWIYDQKDWLLQGEWRSNYGVTEWMINYQGGFLRRGLPGELLFFIGKQTGLDIGWFVLCFCLLLYGVYVWSMIREARRSLPAWALYSAPLLGYPVYSGDLIRKDVFLLLSLLALLKVVTRFRLMPLRQFLIGAISSFALLSHELFFFFGLPLSLFADARICCKRLKGNGLIYRFLFWASGWTPAVITSYFVFTFKGTDSQAFKILSSWSSLRPPGGSFAHQLPGALSWLGKTSQDAIQATHRLLLSTHFGFPFWFFVVLAVSLAALVIAPLFTTPAKSRNFTVCFFAQTVFMFPIYYSALDQGRWIFLTVNSVLIYSLLLDRRQLVGSCWGIQEWSNRLRNAVSPTLSLIALSVWGFPIYGWRFNAWLLGTPLFMVPLKIYYYMRSNGFIPDLF